MVFRKNPKVLRQRIVYKTRKGRKASRLSQASLVEVPIPSSKGGYKKKTLKIEVPKRLKSKRSIEKFVREETHRLLKREHDNKRKAEAEKARKQRRKYEPVKKLPKLKSKISAKQITMKIEENQSLPLRKQKAIANLKEKVTQLIPVVRRADKLRYFITKHEVLVSKKIELQDKDGYTQERVYDVVEEILRQKLHDIFVAGARYYVRTMIEGRSRFLSFKSKTGRRLTRTDPVIEGFSTVISMPIRSEKALDKFIDYFMEEYRNAVDVYLSGALGQFYFRGVMIDEYREV